jgi:hypothetical protein
MKTIKSLRINIGRARFLGWDGGQAPTVNKSGWID